MKKGVKVLGLIVVIIVVTSFFATMVSADDGINDTKSSSSNVIYVPDDYEKIQWAVDNATEGDTIIVKSGTYYESVNVINKPLILRGMDTGTGKPVVDAGRADYALYLSLYGSLIEGFIVTNASFCGIYVGAYNATIANNIISNISGYGIKLEGGFGSNTITNNTISDISGYGISLSYGYGISLDYSSNNSISGNTITNTSGSGLSYSPSGSGIALFYSSNNTFYGNTITNCSNHGIYLEGSLDNPTSKNTLSGNTISNTIREGIYLEGSSTNNTLNSNTISSIRASGIYLERGLLLEDAPTSNTISGNSITNVPYGICLGAGVSGNTIDGNIIDNANRGIKIGQSTSNIIHCNTINNGYYCFWITDSSGNTIYLNDCINNTKNVYSYLSTNIWNSTTPLSYTYNGTTYTNYLGNYWSDYTDTDVDNDGIWDNPYSIDGDGEKDWYPLKEPFEIYIDSNPEGEIIFEDTFNELDQNKWILWGDPKPKVLEQVYGRQGIFDNKGDEVDPSGAVSMQNLCLSSKLPIVIESEVYLDVMNPNGCWAYPTVGLTRENTPTPYDAEGYPLGLQLSLQHVGYGCWLSPSDVRGHSYFYLGFLNESNVWEGIGGYEIGGILADNYTNQWVRLFVLINKDRTVEFYADDELLYKSESKIHSTILENKKIYLGSRSSGSAGKAYHDYVRVRTSPAPPSTLIFEEYFDDLNEWYLVVYDSAGGSENDPEPQLDYSMGRSEPSLDVNGDSWCGNGAYTKQNFDYVDGLVIEFDMYVASGYDWNWGRGGLSDHMPNLANPRADGAYIDPTTCDTRYVAGLHLIDDNNYNSAPPYLDFFIDADDGTTDLYRYSSDASFLENEWHNYKIDIRIDGYVDFYMDGELIWTSTKRVDKTLGFMPLLFGDRDADGPVRIDNVKVYSNLPTNHPPNPPSSLQQFKSDSETVIPVGGTTDERTVVFKGTVSDPDGDRVKLQVELRNLNEYGGQFDETKGGLKDSTSVESGSEAVACAYGLVDADYHWRARAVDENGEPSEWVDFGVNDISEADFTVTSFNQQPVASFTFSPQNPKAGEEVLLDASNSYDPDGGKIKLYEWDLDGDGEYDGFTTSNEIYYYWDESGTYSVKLGVTDTDGATNTSVKDINVAQNSLWDRFKEFLAPSVVTLSKSEKRRFEMIKTELHINTYPHSDEPFSDPDFYWISDDQLLTLLNKKIEPQESDLTYETLIYDTLHDMKLADSIAQPVWTVNPEIEKYFEKMAEVNVWAEAGSAISKEAMKMAIEDLGGSGIGVDCILMLPDLCEAGIGLKLLDETFHRRALWYYFQSRELGFSPEDSFEFALVVDLFRAKYDNEETRDYFEHLWTEYGCSHISNNGGLESDFKKQVRNQLRTLLLSGFEKYKFEPYQVYRIKSPCEVQVYDSQGRATGLVNGELREEIPNSAYDNESKTVLIFNSTDLYYCRMVGSDNGTYQSDMNSVEDGTGTCFSVTNISILKNGTHQYLINWSTLAQGNGGVTVQKDEDGDGLFEENITIQPPFSNFTYSSINPSILETIIFNASNSVDTDGNITNYQWDFGDETNGTDEITTHSYTQAGDYNVILTVTDDDGAQNSIFKVITVSDLEENIFDTDAPANPYPSVMGIHNGTITPFFDINVSKMYTYPCPGTGGHAEYVRIYNASGTLAEAQWNGYEGDWHNLTFNNSFTLYTNETYNYTIRTDSYPQIIHAESKDVTGGTITCTSFEDANGIVHTDWIPAITLY